MGGQALKHISQRVNEISIFGDIQHSTGHGPVQPALTGPSPNGVGLGVWFGVEGVDYMISRGPFQPKLFYDSKTKHDSTVHFSRYLARKDQPWVLITAL